MSRLSELLKERYGKSTETTAEQIIKRYLREHTPQFKELAQVLIAAIDLESMSGKQKQAYVRAMLKGLAKLLLRNVKVTIPDWALNAFIDYLVAKMRLGDEQEEPTPEQPPVEEPSLYETFFSTEPDWALYGDGDTAWTDNPTQPTEWWVVQAGAPPFPPPRFEKYGVVEGGQLTLVVQS